MARSLLSDVQTGGFGLAWGLLVVAATFSVISMAIFVCTGKKKRPSNDTKYGTGTGTAAASAAAGSASTPSVGC